MMLYESYHKKTYEADRPVHQQSDQLIYCCQIVQKLPYRRMAENGFALSPREFRRHILSCRELKAESFKRCLHSVLRGVSL